jgi:hypothetical protein
MLYTGTIYQEAVVAEKKCYETFLPLTINVENLTKSVKRKWMKDSPEIDSYCMGPCVTAVYQI